MEDRLELSVTASLTLNLFLASWLREKSSFLLSCIFCMSTPPMHQSAHAPRALPRPLTHLECCYLGHRLLCLLHILHTMLQTVHGIFSKALRF